MSNKRPKYKVTTRLNKVPVKIHPYYFNGFPELTEGQSSPDAPISFKFIIFTHYLDAQPKKSYPLENY